MRKSWDEYFIGLATAVSQRSTCDRLHVGCVLVVDKRILSTGYNGSLPGLPHCDDVGHLLMNEHCVATEHAERNAIASAAKAGTSTKGATAYITHSPCWDCFKHMVSAGIKRIIYKTDYLSWRQKYPEGMDEILVQADVTLIRIGDYE